MPTHPGDPGIYQPPWVCKLTAHNKPLYRLLVPVSSVHSISPKNPKQQHFESDREAGREDTVSSTAQGTRPGIGKSLPRVRRIKVGAQEGVAFAPVIHKVRNSSGRAEGELTAQESCLLPSDTLVTLIRCMHRKHFYVK